MEQAADHSSSSLRAGALFLSSPPTLGHLSTAGLIVEWELRNCLLNLG